MDLCLPYVEMTDIVVIFVQLQLGDYNFLRPNMGLDIFRESIWSEAFSAGGVEKFQLYIIMGL